jgi:iron complex transport system ATP-binding protein
VLRELTFEIERGEFIGVVGPNGAGKTTLLRLLSGILTPTRGEIMLDGLSLRSISARERARRIAVVPQFEDVVFPFTVRSMVLLGRAPHLGGLGYERETDFAAADRAMRLADVTDIAERRVTDLSGGELHRVLIARALAQDTPLLLLDEPNAHLDIRHQVALFDLLLRLHADSRTIFCITHDLNLAAMYCSRILLLSEYTIVADGSPVDVLTPVMILRHFGIRVAVDLYDATPYIRLLKQSD